MTHSGSGSNSINNFLSQSIVQQHPGFFITLVTHSHPVFPFPFSCQLVNCPWYYYITPLLIELRIIYFSLYSSQIYTNTDNACRNVSPETFSSEAHFCAVVNQKESKTKALHTSPKTKL